MQLVEQHIIKRDNKFFKTCDEITFKTKNLYNVANYECRQHYFEHKKTLSYKALDALLNKGNEDYKALPAKVAQQVLRLYDQNRRSAFASRRSEKVKHKVGLPGYLHKSRGRFVAVYTIQALSKKWLQKGIVAPSQTNIRIKTNQHPSSINQVRIVPRFGCFVIEVIYTVADKTPKEDTGKYAGGDIGVNNLLVVGFNNKRGFIVNGRPLKSINQFYNKRLAKLKSEAKKHGVEVTHRIEKLTRKRNCKINDYMHKASTLVVRQLVANDVSTFVVGHNKGWKLEVNMGRKNNQNFVDIPFDKFINMLQYKCQREGITLIQIDEKHTSKCSFLDNEPICHHDNYIGTRFKRGLFRSGDGRIINADLNGALNILRKAKVAGENQYSVEAGSTPLVSTIKFNERNCL